MLLVQLSSVFYREYIVLLLLLLLLL